MSIDFLVTGGLGFQGYHIVKMLLSMGASIRILARDSDHARRNWGLLPQKDLRLVWGDITSEETVRAATRDCKMIIHLAAQINVDESIKFPERSFATNWVGIMNVLRAALQNKSAMILASTCEVYGSNTLSSPMSENHPMNPQSPYAATKAGADRLAYSYYCSFDMPLVILRPGNVYGWGQKAGVNGAVIPKFITKAMKGEPLIVFGDGSQGRYFIYVDDVVEGYIKVIENFYSVVGQAFNLGTGQNTTIGEIANVISELGNVPIEYVPERPGEVMSFALDSSKVKALGWEPKIDIKQGLLRTWEDIKNKGI